MKKLTIVLIAISLGLVAWFVLRPGEPEPLPVQRDAVTLRTTLAGKVVGSIDTWGARAWLGMPYAQPPVGELRWRAPQPPSHWTGTREALAVGDLCPQYHSALSGGDVQAPPSGALLGKEDCLYLNVWAPANAIRRPVMLWLHGGGNSVGHGGSYNGARLAAEYNVVVITINYRLGPLGWFSHPALATGSPLDDSGNFGTLDVVRALEWTRDNIAEFGGDPSQVTLFGESAGGSDILAMMASPLARGLFHRAIVQSGGYTPSTMAKARNYAAEGGEPFSAREVVNHLLVADGTSIDLAAARTHQDSLSPAALHEYLYAKTPDDILDIFQGRGFGMIPSPSLFMDGHVLPELSAAELFSNADSHNAVPIILGSNRDEPATFMVFDPRNVQSFLWVFRRLRDQPAYLREVKYGAQAWKARGVDELAEAMTRAGNPSVYAYRFDWDEEGSLLGFDVGVAVGAGHGLEMAFVFGDFDGGLGLGYIYRDSPRKDDLARSMMSYWTEFARTGNPGRGSAGAEPQWLGWGADGQRSILLDTPDDQGIRMMDQLVTTASVKAAIADDPEIATQRERCELYTRVFNWNGDWDQAEYDQFGPEGCTAYDPAQFRVFADSHSDAG